MTLFPRLVKLLRLPHKRALLDLQRLLRGQARLHFLAVLAETRMAERLRAPRQRAELATELGVERLDLLDSFLALGVATRDLHARDDGFVVRSATARALSTPSGTPLACFLREIASYHASAFRSLPESLSGAPDADYLKDYGALVAGASRIVQSLLEVFVDELTRGLDGLHILDIGCGTASYLTSAAMRNNEHHGIVVDVDEAVVAIAEQNLREYDLSERFVARAVDIRTAEKLSTQPFDLVLAFQNVYYFSPDERLALFEKVRAQLAKGGRFGIATVCASQRWISQYYALLLGATAGCYPIPRRTTLEAELRSAGFEQVRSSRLMPADEFWGIVAYA